MVFRVLFLLYSGRKKFFLYAVGQTLFLLESLVFKDDEQVNTYDLSFYGLITPPIEYCGDWMSNLLTIIHASENELIQHETILY